jgi:hypothetical protein
MVSASRARLNDGVSRSLRRCSIVFIPTYYTLAVRFAICFFVYFDALLLAFSTISDRPAQQIVAGNAYWTLPLELEAVDAAFLNSALDHSSQLAIIVSRCCRATTSIGRL